MKLYAIMSKDLATGDVKLENVYGSLAYAESVMEELMSAHVERRAFKIETRVVVASQPQPKADPLAGVDKYHPVSPAHLLLLLKHGVKRIGEIRTIAAGHGYMIRGKRANTKDGFVEMFTAAVLARGNIMEQPFDFYA